MRLHEVWVLQRCLKVVLDILSDVVDWLHCKLLVVYESCNRLQFTHMPPVPRDQFLFLFNFDLVRSGALARAQALDVRLQ